MGGQAQLLFVLAAALLSACATRSLPPPDIAAARVSFGTHVSLLMAHAEIFKPEGEGPFPTVVMFHACLDERAASQRTWAGRIRDARWAAIVVDSYSSRGISRLEALTVCLGFKLWGRERAGDVFAAVAWARQQPWVDRNRIVAAGWSHGGWAVLDALAMPRGEYAEASTRLRGLPVEPLEGVVGAFVFYPYVGLGSVTRETRALMYDAHTIVIVASNDAIVGSRNVARVLEAAGSSIRVERFDGATHAFDMPEVRDPLVRYSAEHEQRAHVLLIDFLTSMAATENEP